MTSPASFPLPLTRPLHRAWAWRALVAVIAAAGSLLAGPQIATSVVAPLDALSYTVSPQGSRVGAVIRKGSRMVVVVDGVEGPRLDNVSVLFEQRESAGDVPTQVSGPRQILFSPDGSQFVYAGKIGPDLVIFLNHQEVHRTTDHIWALGGYARLRPAFSKTGNVLYFGSSVAGEQDAALTRIIVNGKPGPLIRPDDQPFDFTISHDGQRHAYSAPKPHSRERGFFVDGQEVPYPGAHPQFTKDGRTLVALDAASPARTLYVNGRVALATEGKIRRVLVAATGRTVAAVFHPEPGQRKASLWIDGQVVLTEETIQEVFLSPGGRHWAAVCGNTGSPAFHWVVADGKRGPDYANIDLIGKEERPGFTVDGKFVYVAISDRSRFVVHGEDPSAALNLPQLYFSPDRKRVAYMDLEHLSVDGITYPGSRYGVVAGRGAFMKESFTFSPDGQRFAFASRQSLAPLLIVDGCLIAGFSPTQVKFSPTQHAARGFFRFSPDGQRYAAVGEITATRERELRVDNQPLISLSRGESTPDLLDFTPDSRQVIWRQAYRNPESRQFVYRVMLGTATLLEYDRQHPLSQALNNVEGSWQLGPDGKLRLLTVTSEGIVRHTLTL